MCVLGILGPTQQWDTRAMQWTSAAPGVMRRQATGERMFTHALNV